MDENSSTNFTFNITGGPSAVGTIILNDSSETNIPVQDIGASQNGRLWAVGMNDNILYYRDLGAATWTATAVTNALRVDGGKGNDCYYVTTTNNVRLFDASTNTNSQIYNGALATDVGSVWDGFPYIVANSGALYRYAGSGLGTHGSVTWPQVGTSTNNINVDGDPSTGDAIVSKTTNNVARVTSAGVNTGLGRPAIATASNNANDIAVDANGNIYAIYRATSSVTGSQGSFPFKWVSGTTWTNDETTGGNSNLSSGRITGGVANQVWMLQSTTGTFPNGTIFSRTDNNGTIFWYDNDWLRSSGNNTNSVMIAVIPGTYTLTETLPGGWDLTAIDMYDPSNNSSGVVATQVSTLNVATGEVVHVNYTNQLANITAISTSCSGSILQNFGSGVAAIGSPLSGKTSYHYQALSKVDDGYYTIIKNSTAWGNTTLTDHSGIANGYFMAVNASYTANEFYRQRVSGLIVGASYTFSFWGANLSSGINPDITIGCTDINTGAVLTSTTTGNITASSWTKYSFTFTATVSSLDIFIRNNGQGGWGNDVAIDDIVFELQPISSPITVSATDANCAGTGSITVTTPSGAAYEYSINGTTYQSSATFSVAPGSYTVYARYVGSTCVANTTTTVKPSACGYIYADANGMSDNQVNNSGGTLPSGLYLVLYDNTTGQVASVSTVALDGSYSLNATAGNSYTVYLTTTSATVGQTAVPTVTLPSGWVNTGEKNGSGTGSDGTPNGILSLGTVSANVSNINFGIEQIPTANNATAASQQNPGGNYKVTVPTLSGSDPEQGSFPGTGNADTILIKTLPANGTLYYNGVAVNAGDTIKNYNPSLLTVDPNDGISSLTFTFTEVDGALKGGNTATVTMPFTSPTIFSCTNTAFYMASDPTIMYTVNISTGVATSFATLSTKANALAYNETDNLLWGWDQNNGRIIRIDAAGATTSFSVPNLPAQSFICGTVITGGYLVLYQNNNASYYVVNINPASANYLQLVDPTAAYAKQTGPTYGKSVSAVDLHDFAYNPVSGLIQGIISPGSANQFKLVTINPLTNTTTIASSAISGAGITSETGTFGAAICDVNGDLYVNNGGSGKYYYINTAINTALLVSTGSTFGNTDAAMCTNASLSVAITGTVYQDANGLTDNLINGTGNNAGGVNMVLYDNTIGAVKAVAPVAANGTYSLSAFYNKAQTLYLTTTAVTVGQTAVPTVTLPSGWANTGEKNGSGTGSDGTANGILSLGTVSANVSNANFGIEQTPVTNAVTSSGCASSGITIGTLNGTDAEDGSIGSGGTVVINTLPASGSLKYNNVAVTAGQTISSYNPSLLTFTPAGGGTVTFTYSVKDAAGIASASAATVTINVSAAGQWVGGTSGDWNNASNWCGGIPTSTTNVTIPNGSTVNIQSANAVANTVNIATGGSLVMTGSYNLNITAGGSFANSGSFTATSSTGTINFLGNGTISGTTTFNNIDTYGALNFGTASTVSGTFSIQTGGSVTGNSPSYVCPTGTLAYKPGGVFNRGLEWTSSASGAGYPANVYVQNNTTINFPVNGDGHVCYDMVIDNGSALAQNYSGGSASLRIGRNITISGTLSLGNATGGDIYVGGNWIRSTGAVFNHNDRKVIFDGPANFSGNGTSMSTITAPASSAKDNEGGFGGEQFAHIWIDKTNATDSVVLLSNITVTRELGLTKGVFSLRNNDVTLVSNATRTADVAPITNTANTSIRYGGTGKFAVQRFIQNPTGTRSWRLLAAPLQAATAPTINEAWQEGVVNPNRSTPNADGGAYNPWPGYGTHITGPGGTYSLANGFDHGTNSASVLYAGTGVTAWASPASTTGTKITDEQGWMLFVRGDRSFAIGNQYVPSQNATLEPKGRINTGDVSVLLPAGKNIVGNPYPSAISLLNVDVAGTAGKNCTYYMWDPKMFTSYTQPGKWVTFTGIGNSFVQTTSESAYTSNGKVESGQAFVFDVPAAGNVTFHESDKLPLNSSLVGISNATAARPMQNQRYSLFRSDVYAKSDTAYKLTDGVLNVFNDSYNNAADKADAAKLISLNTKESMSILRDSVKLAIEKRNSIQVADTIFFTMAKFNEIPYRFRFEAKDFAPGLEAFLEDKFTGSRTPVNTDGVTEVDYTITSDPLSKVADRFRVVFKNNGITLPVTFASVNAFQENKNIVVEWEAANEINIQKYEVERSVDGINFVKVASQSSLGNTSGNNAYKWVDGNAAAGSSYYRIVSVGINGDLQTSRIVKVTIAAAGSITVYPNPVTNGILRLAFKNLEKGKYAVQLFSSSGQKVLSASVEYDGGNVIKELHVPKSIAEGAYTLKAGNPNGTEEQITVFIR